MKRALVLAVAVVFALGIVAYSQAYMDLNWVQEGVQTPSMTIRATLGVYSPYFWGGLHGQTYHTFIFKNVGDTWTTTWEDGGWLIYGYDESYLKVGMWYNSETGMHFGVQMHLSFESYLPTMETDKPGGV